MGRTKFWIIFGVCLAVFYAVVLFSNMFFLGLAFWPSVVVTTILVILMLGVTARDVPAPPLKMREPQNPFDKEERGTKPKP